MALFSSSHFLDKKFKDFKSSVIVCGSKEVRRKELKDVCCWLLGCFSEERKDFNVFIGFFVETFVAEDGSVHNQWGVSCATGHEGHGSLREGVQPFVGTPSSPVAPVDNIDWRKKARFQPAQWRPLGMGLVIGILDSLFVSALWQTLCVCLATHASLLAKVTLRCRVVGPCCSAGNRLMFRRTSKEHVSWEKGHPSWVILWLKGFHDFCPTLVG